MGFISNLFHSDKKSESVILIHISTDSVAGAYAQFTEGELPVLLYTRRLPVEVREGGLPEQAMVRALQTLADTLIREGAPILARHTGSGSAHSILVSIDAPWQKTAVRIEHLEQRESFVFSRDLVAALVKKTKSKTPGKLIVDESVIGTILNGYETRDPYGKRVSRAAVVILTSFIDELVAKNILSTLQGAYHTKNILPIAGSSLRFQALHMAFPHEDDALILDATGPLTSIALIHRGLFVAVVEVSDTDAHDSWMKNVTDELAGLAKQYPLPRTIFLLAGEPKIFSLQKKLDADGLGKLWLSDNPPKVVPVLASHMVGLVRQATTAPPDLALLFMALFFRQRVLGQKIQ